MKDNNPLVSVVVPCFNHEKFVQECIQSIIEQDYKNIELIVIDDGSKDKSVEIIKSLISDCRKRFKKFIFLYRENKGLCETLNEAIELCSGKYFCCLASDDIIYKDKISYQVSYLEAHTESLGVFGGVEIIGLNRSEVLKTKRVVRSKFDDIYLHKHLLMAPTQMLRLDAVKNAGGFNKDFLIEDWYMWLALTKNGGTLDCVDKVFAKYRRHEDNMSSKFDLMHKGRMQIINFFKNKNYNRAFSNIHLIRSQEIVRKNLGEAFSSLIVALRSSKEIIFSKLFFRTLIILIVRGIFRIGRS
ncbi:glycosyltransferase [Comamonas aquatica]|uniref:glycosyltransferase n=1 Tax=Comamonas aquatica TaxID=225991 RepID=UPI00146FEC38|nr:glycosyltransferase [Comamonas aquatica]